MQPNGKLTLDNLTLSGASTNNEPSGAVINNGILVVNNVTFTGNHAGTGADRFLVLRTALYEADLCLMPKIKITQTIKARVI